MLGISVYFSMLDNDYLDQAIAHGVTVIFTSLHIPEEELVDLDHSVKKLLAYQSNNKLKIVTDVSPVTFQKLGLKPNDFKRLKKMGFTALRLDFGFDNLMLVKSLLDDFEIFLNASVISKQYLEDCVAQGIDPSRLNVCHNFYPKKETGLSDDYYCEINEKFKAYGLPIYTFVPGDRLKRFPLYEGLPTLESQRGKNTYIAGLELYKRFGIKDIIVGDTMALDSSIRYLNDFFETHIMTLPVSMLEPTEDEKKMIPVRKDLSAKVIRLESDRIKELPIKTTQSRQKGTITQENTLSGRYSGEIQIAKEDLPFSATSNTIGFVHPAYSEALNYVDSETIIKFVPFSDILL